MACEASGFVVEDKESLIRSGMFRVGRECALGEFGVDRDGLRMGRGDHADGNHWFSATCREPESGLRGRAGLFGLRGRSQEV